MKTLKIDYGWNLPENYSGILDYGYCIEYYLNGKSHREDGPAVIRKDGTISYYLNGKSHREDGPAVIRKDGTISYYLNGKSHREDGPAVIWKYNREEWFLNNKDITEEVNIWIKENNIPEFWDKSHII